MKLTLLTLRISENSTLGALYIDGEFECFTLEDTVRKQKVYGSTAISGGIFNIALRKGSPMAMRYDKAYRTIGHKGMLWLKNVPNFKWIYLHPGNTYKDTEGCILVGDVADVKDNDAILRRSRSAYTRLYQRVQAAIESGLRVQIEIVR